MEFCENKTLREVINSGEFVRNTSLMWTLFRQLVEGINYFHNMNIIHRDLKPENVFLKTYDCVKIGDFGLATAQPNMVDSKTLSGGKIASNRSKLTTHCGTNLYMAPELATGKYDTKADMYSLGIISFEMCHHPFDTEMERRVELTKLRNSDYESLSCVLPFPVEETLRKYHGPQTVPLLTKDMGEIIGLLLKDDPEERPSAEELLESSHMSPPLLDKLDEFFQLAESILLSRNKDDLIDTNFDYARLMQLCLEQSTPEYEIFNWLYRKKSKPALISQNDNSLTIYLQPDILKCFIRRCQETGAQYFQPSTLLPQISTEHDYDCEGLKNLASILEKCSISQTFIDLNGTLLVLPIDSFTSFARHVASYGLTELKRFCIQQVYQTNHAYSSGHPPEPSNTELTLDIVSPPSSTSKVLRQADAELIKVFDKVLNRDCQLSFVILQLSHRKLIESILIYCKVPLDERSQICRKLHNTLMDQCVNGLGSDTHNNPEFQQILRIMLGLKGISVKHAKAYLDSMSDWIGSEAASIANAAFGELEEIMQQLSKANNRKGLSCMILISLSFGLEFYDTHSGFLFSFIHEWRTTNELAKGGRYDGLVHSFRKVMANCPITELTEEFKEQDDLQELLDGRLRQHVTGGAISLNKLVTANHKCKQSFPNY